MSTRWAVTVASEQITLDSQRSGEAAFTVTNPGAVTDRVVFEVVPDDGAEVSWFSVAEPQRLVRGGASVSYVVKVAVPPGATPGSYAVQALVYSADSAPEESSVLSPRVVLEVPADEPQPSRRWPWWWFAIGGGVVVALALVVGLVVAVGRDGADAQPTPAATPGVMPDVVGLTEREALRLLVQHDIGVRSPRYIHDPERAGTVLAQSIAPGEPARSEFGVELDVAVELVAPQVRSPIGVVEVTSDEPSPQLRWDPASTPTNRWQVRLQRESCTLTPAAGALTPSTRGDLSCSYETAGFDAPDRPFASFEMARPSSYTFVSPNGSATFGTGWYRWQVEAVDDNFTSGPPSDLTYFRLMPADG